MGEYDDVEFDGEDLEILPERFQKILALLPEPTGQRVIDWITGYTIAGIDAQADRILGGLRDEFQPPVNPATMVTPVEPEEPTDPWEDAQHAIDQIGTMFERLSKAGMTEDAAMATIAAQMRAMNGATRGYANIVTAGAHFTNGDEDLTTVADAIGLPRGMPSYWPPGR